VVTVGALALVFGTCLIVASATSLLLKAAAIRQRQLTESTSITPVGSWRPGTRRVAAHATTAFGPGGPVIAPVSGVECAWFAVQLQRMPSRSKDESPPPYDVLVDIASPMPPALVDESGSVLIDPALLTEAPNLDDPVVTDVTMRLAFGGLPNPAPSIVTRKHLDDARTSESLRVVETRLDAGKQAYAFGSAAQHNGSVMLKPTRRGSFSVLTTDNHSTVLTRRHTNAKDAGSLAIVLGKAGLVITAAAAVLLFLVV